MYKTDRKSLHRALLWEGFELVDTQFAGGQSANNKLLLDYDKVKQNKRLYSWVLGGLCNVIEPYKPDFVAGMPNGATGYAEAVGTRLGIEVVRLAKVEKTKQIVFASEEDRETAELGEHGVAVEDVMNRRTTLKKGIDLLGDKVFLAVGIFDRGMPGECLDLGVPIESLAQEPIPAMLPRRHELRRFARDA